MWHANSLTFISFLGQHIIQYGSFSWSWKQNLLLIFSYFHSPVPVEVICFVLRLMKLHNHKFWNKSNHLNRYNQVNNKRLMLICKLRCTNTVPWPLVFWNTNSESACGKRLGLNALNIHKHAMEHMRRLLYSIIMFYKDACIWLGTVHVCHQWFRV